MNQPIEKASRCLIEQALPVKELSREGAREKAIRHGHISTLHVWWARRPLVTARAAVFACLVEADQMDGVGFEKFVANLCQWEMHDGNPVGRHLLEQAQAIRVKRPRPGSAIRFFTTLGAS